ncbi:MAG: hypothetical protein ABEH64_04345 [Salinirussus sp.]
MTATVFGALATAGVLGVTHALEPDHIAGISSLTGRYGDSRLSAIVGACFGAGHVVLVVAWLGLSWLILRRTGYPAVLDTVGSLIVGVALGVLGAILAMKGYRVAARSHGQAGHAHTDADPHLHLPFLTDGDHRHSTRTYLKTGIIGALFTLSPPLSMIAFLGAVLPSLGLGIAALSVLAYAAGITMTMATIGASVGSAFGLVSGHDRAAGLFQIVAGLVVMGFASVIVVGTL